MKIKNEMKWTGDERPQEDSPHIPSFFHEKLDIKKRAIDGCSLFLTMEAVVGFGRTIPTTMGVPKGTYPDILPQHGSFVRLQERNASTYEIKETRYCKRKH